MTEIRKILNKNNIEFICESPEVDYFDKPVAASKMLPDWYKELPSYTSNTKQYDSNGVNATLKRCMPVFDMATTGYYITLPADVIVTRDALGEPTFTWGIPWKMVTEHSLIQLPTYPFPKGYRPQALKWANPWVIKTPRGWSTMFIQPEYYPDLPFRILPAIVDTDGFELSVQFPFILRSDFEGIIKAGTPIVQVIPFKRASWFSSFSVMPFGQKEKSLSKHSRALENRYKKTFWNKKEYK